MTTTQSRPDEPRAFTVVRDDRPGTLRHALRNAAEIEEPNADDQRTYAETWADSINETYTDDPYDVDVLAGEWLFDSEPFTPDMAGTTAEPHTHEEVRRFLLLALAKAAMCLRSDVPATFTHPELDLIRHLMPAHVVHQSGSKRWVLAVMCETEDERKLVRDYYYEHMSDREREILDRAEEQEK